MENNDVMNLYKQKLKEQFNPNDRPDNCLHCGVGKPYYCESCYQQLVAENLKLQTRIKELEKLNKGSIING